MVARLLKYGTEEERRIATPMTADLHGNDFPAGWEPITEAEFAKSEFFNGWVAMEHRQMFQENKAVHAYLFHFHGGDGIAIENDFWGGKIRYYRFGCKHEYSEALGDEHAVEIGMRLGHCDHAYKCMKCGHFMVQNSSD